MLDVLEIAQVLQAEGVAVSQSDRLDGRDAGVTDDEALPLPRSRRKTEQVTHEDTVGSGVSDERDLLAWLLDVPNGQLTFDPMDAALGKEIGRPRMDARNEVSNRLATLKAMPPIG